MRAARWGNTEVIVELVKAGAHVDMQNRVCQYLYVIHLCVYMYVATGMYMYLGEWE